MALTIGAQTRNAAGGRWQTVTKITVDTSYPTGGWALTNAQLGLPLQVDSAVGIFTGVSGAGGANVQYDPVNQKLMCYGGNTANNPHLEITNGTNLSTQLANLSIAAVGR
jgi:hypothetical protein